MFSELCRKAPRSCYCSEVCVTHKGANHRYRDHITDMQWSVVKSHRLGIPIQKYLRLSVYLSNFVSFFINSF